MEFRLCSGRRKRKKKRRIIRQHEATPENMTSDRPTFPYRQLTVVSSSWQATKFTMKEKKCHQITGGISISKVRPSLCIRVSLSRSVSSAARLPTNSARLYCGGESGGLLTSLAAAFITSWLTSLKHATSAPVSASRRVLTSTSRSMKTRRFVAQNIPNLGEAEKCDLSVGNV